MRVRVMALSVAVVAAVCAASAPEASAGDGMIWRLVDLDGQPVAATVMLDLSRPGQVAGQAPCNRYSGRYEGELPDFRPGPLRATKMACEALALEGAFFRALGAVTRAETDCDRLILTGEGVRMEFVRAVD